MGKEQQEITTSHPLYQVLTGQAFLPPAGPPPLDLEAQGRLARDHAQAARRRTEQEKMIAAAKERERTFLEARGKAREDAQRVAAVQLEAQTKEHYLQEWLQTGGFKEDFEQQWPAQYLRIQQERVAETKARMQQRIGSLF